MAEFTKNVHRHAPYKTCKFEVFLGNEPIPGVSRVSGLRRTTEPVADRGGGDPSTSIYSPGQTTYEPIQLERGQTHDPTFEQWANQVFNVTGDEGKETSLKTFKKDLRIALYNEAGQIVMAYNVYNCWPREYVALDELDASTSETATESITLQHEGWQRDYDISEPEEPSFTEPPE